METEGRLRMADVFVGIRDPRQAKKVEHDLVELLVIAVWKTRDRPRFLLFLRCGVSVPAASRRTLPR